MAVVGLELQEIRVPGGPQAPSRVRSALDRGLGDELDDEQLASLRLLASEVVTNSILHGGVGPDGWITASVAVGIDHVRFEVRDAGGPSEPAPRTPNYDEGGGFGLFLVDKLAARWGVERSSDVCVWFELPL